MLNIKSPITQRVITASNNSLSNMCASILHTKFDWNHVIQENDNQIWEEVELRVGKLNYLCPKFVIYWIITKLLFDIIYGQYWRSLKKYKYLVILWIPSTFSEDVKFLNFFLTGFSSIKNFNIDCCLKICWFLIIKVMVLVRKLMFFGKFQNSKAAIVLRFKDILAINPTSGTILLLIQRMDDNIIK